MWRNPQFKRELRAKKKSFILCMSILLILTSIHFVSAYYQNYTGKIETQIIYEVEVDEEVSAKGFVVRDEQVKQNGKNISILEKDDGGYYYPLIEDGTSVAKNMTVAYRFSSESQMQVYDEIINLQNQIDYFEDLQSKTSKFYLTLDAVNKQLKTEAFNYIDILNSNDLSALESTALDMNISVVSKNVILGEKYDFTEQIEKLTKAKINLQKQISTKNTFSAIHAGFFVSLVDGYEETVDFKSVDTKNFLPNDIEKIYNTQQKVSENTFGKIISQNKWYYICNIETNKATRLETALVKGYNVYVDFVDKYIEDVPMKVQSIGRAEQKGYVSVVLYCTGLNKSYSTLRIENAKIRIQSEEGFRVERDAIVKNDEGLFGVYVKNFNLLEFKPVNFLQYEKDYVIIEAYSPVVKTYEDKVDDTKQDITKIYKTLKSYDSVVVKGNNLENGKFVY